MTPRDLILATHNPNKVREFGQILPPGFGALSLDQVGFHDDVPETRDTIAGNALQKVEFIWERLRRDCVADDTGLIVEALGGEPGVFSARYAGPERDDSRNIDKLLRELGPNPDRRAHFLTVVALCWKGQLYTFEGRVDGSITLAPRGKGGFGYDPLFQPLGYGSIFAEMPAENKNKISHRALAISKLVQFLQSLA